LHKMGVPVGVFTVEGQFSIVGIGVSFLFYAFRFFVVGLTVTVLCKTYLISVKNAEQLT
jgi:hypothetical protein